MKQKNKMADIKTKFVESFKTAIESEMFYSHKKNIQNEYQL